MPMEKTPVSLLERLRRPDEGAWARFVDLYTPLLYFWACRLGLQQADAADLVQDVFTILVQKIPEFNYDKNKSFRSWLRTVTMNRWHDNLRRKTAAPHDVGSAGLEDVAVPDVGETLWEKEYRDHVVARAAEVMKAEFQPATWQAFWSVTVEGKSAAEAAAALGLSVGAVYTAKSRVLRRLRQELEGMLE
jgi:RNA polymerase sigma-70 factor (ECF subfamily)